MKKITVLFATVVWLVSACATAPATQSSGLTFFHLNDVYRVDAVEDGTAGGLSRVLTLVREAQAQGRDVRILHGGDFLYPSLESQLWDGLQMVDAMNLLNAVAPLYAVAGNHEFDRSGPEQLVAALHASDFEWLGDNYSLRTGDAAADAMLRTGFVFQSGDKTVGVFSVTLHGDDGGNNRDYVDIDRDYQGAAERAIAALDARGVDLIIGVTHIHMWEDVAIAKLQADFPQLAFIVGGHEHELQYSKVADSAIVMKGASNARVIWRIDVDFTGSQAYVVNEQRIVLDESIAFDADYEVLANKWRSLLLKKYPLLEARVGTAGHRMDAREETIRSRETSWGNFVTDQMRKAFGDPPANLAFINSGTLRIDDFIEDDIRFEDIGRTFGFSSFLRYTTVTGTEFKRIMEAGYRGGPAAQGYFPQVSGFRVCIDRSRKEFDRIVSLQVPSNHGWQEIEADREYLLVVPDFLYDGGDGYEVPKDRFASRPGSELKYLVLDEILRAHGSGASVGEPVTRENRRFHQLLESKEPCFSN
ncbi:MAG: bifunctional metallophosphatase/5'-nucleotidase [Chromatiales bacterium]|nr:MAG: bifunctional metallophosphatase/5'-nucleotidase [Chromatiales bacterium]